MRLNLHRSATAFLEALRAENGATYVIFDRSGASAAVLRGAAAIGAERGHRDLTAIEALRQPAERLMRDYFDAAARADSEASYAYSSRVLLAIPNYPDVALLFLLRAYASAQPESVSHVLASDPETATLVAASVNGAPWPSPSSSSIRGLARALRSLGRRMLAPRAPEACDVLVFTLGENVGRGEPDAYFGHFSEALGHSGRVLTVYAAPGRRLRLDSPPGVASLEAFLRPLDALRGWFRALSHARAVRDGSMDPLTAYLRRREHAAGEVAMLEVMALAFDRMLARLRPRTLVYPFENRSWEKRLLRAARRHGVRCCVGYQHSSLTPRHFAFSGTAGLSGLADLPDRIVTCGEVTSRLIATNMPQARHLLGTGAALRARRIDVAPVERWALLVPISSSRAEAWEMLRVVHAFSGECAVPVVVRTHPTIPIDDLYSQFAWPAQVSLSRGRTLAQDFAETAVVAYSSSTVALEGLLYGRLPIFVDIGDIPSGDPLHGDHAFITRVRNGSELARAVASLRERTRAELDALREAGRAYAERYLIDPSAERMERMAELVTTC